MKKRALILVACLLFTVSSAAAAEGLLIPSNWISEISIIRGEALNACRHVYLKGGMIASRCGYYALNDDVHEYRTYFNILCVHCETRAVCFKADPPQYHDPYCVGDDHVDGQSIHAYYFKCGSCDATSALEYVCSGTGAGDCKRLEFSSEKGFEGGQT